MTGRRYLVEARSEQGIVRVWVEANDADGAAAACAQVPGAIRVYRSERADEPAQQPPAKRRTR